MRSLIVSSSIIMMSAPVLAEPATPATPAMPEMEVELHWIPPPAPPPLGEMEVELHWTPAPATPPPPKDEMQVELHWTPAVVAHASTPAIRKTLTVGALARVGAGEREGGQGVRGELDLTAIGGWRFGAAVSMSHARDWVYRAMDTGEVDTLDMCAVGYVARSAELGGWQVRSALGAGLVGTRLGATMYSGTDDNHAAYAWPSAVGAFPIAEASATVGYELIPDWALHVGPTLTWFGERFGAGKVAGGTLPARDLEGMLFVGLRHRL